MTTEGGEVKRLKYFVGLNDAAALRCVSGPTEVVLASAHDATVSRLTAELAEAKRELARMGDALDARGKRINALMDRQLAALAREKVMAEALIAIKAKCAAPALERDQRDAVHFAYNTADAALAAVGEKVSV